MAAALMLKQTIKLGRSLSRSLNINLQGEKLIREQCRRLPGLLIFYFCFMLEH